MMLEGGCHCGAIEVRFGTTRPLEPRACDCSFCRRHGARTVTDPQGHATIRLAEAAVRYRFGLRTADFLLCPRCGVYVASLIDVEGQNRATLNLNCLADGFPELIAQPVSYDGEVRDARIARRRATWTPAILEHA